MALRRYFFLLALFFIGSSPAAAQAPLYLSNAQTDIRKLSFKFVDTQTFSTDRLKQQIATAAPTTWDRVKRVIPFILRPGEYRLDPVTLQKDVVRLRRFYQQNGFLDPRIDYPASQLDTTSNTIHVIFSIKEGPPLIIQDASFFGPDTARYAESLFDPPLRERWVDFRDQTTLRVGERYTEFNRIRIEDEVRQWLQNQGFAFAEVGAVTQIDSTNHTADIQFILDPGPRGRFAEIDIDGNQSIGRSIVERELPFQVGDPFSHQALLDGQRQLFGLNLFRVVLADVPDQPRDSTVQVRYRVRETPLRYLSAQTGYGTRAGLTGEGSWTHRNLFGGARNLTVSALSETGIGANPSLITSTVTRPEPDRRYRASVSLRQPYVFNNRLSAGIQPFIEYRRNTKLSPQPPILGIPFLDINARDFGLNTQLVYDLLPYRTISLRHTFTRSTFFGDASTEEDTVQTGDLFDKSIFTAEATLGRLDDYLSPSRGFRIRPSAELGGAVLGSNVEYVKVSNEVNGYLPLTSDVDLTGRLFVGRVWPIGRSKDELERGSEIFENRFDDIVFYAGGSSDLRGWRPQLVGDKTARELETDGTVTYIFEPEGGTAKLVGNLELRLPFPGLGSEWRSAVFLDAGQVRDGSFVPTELRFGTGAGIRYQTPVGFLRLDLAYKLNPGPNDLRDPEDVLETIDDPRFRNRFALHVGIGQSF